MALITKNIFSSKKLTWLFSLGLIVSVGIFTKQLTELKNIKSFNQEIAEGKSPHMFIKSFKAVRDGVADWLGVDDGSSLVDWQYCQRSGGPKVYKVEIEVIG